MRRARRQPATDPDVRIQQRLNQVEGAPEPWRAGSSSDNGPLRIVRGTVASGGSPSLGGGYSSSRTGLGTYTVTFTVPFANNPTVVITCETYASGASIGSTSTTQFTLTTYDDNTAVTVDRVFHFIAIGPAT